MWSRWGPKGGLVSEAPWGPRLILAATSKLPSEKTEKCNTGSYWWSSSDKNGTEECFGYLVLADHHSLIH